MSCTVQETIDHLKSMINKLEQLPRYMPVQLVDQYGSICEPLSPKDLFLSTECDEIQIVVEN